MQEECYEWISLQYYDEESDLDQEDMSDIFCDPILSKMEQEVPYGKLAYFIKYNVEKKENGKRVYFKDRKIGFILLLQMKKGPLELRCGLVEEARNHKYIFEALKQLLEIIAGNEQVLDYRERFRAVEKGLPNYYIFAKAHVNDEQINHIASKTGRYEYQDGDYNIYGYNLKKSSEEAEKILGKNNFH